LHEKAQGNIAAIRLLKSLEADNREATDEEKALLARYVGWGGMPNVFGYAPPDEWRNTAGAVRDLLTDAEYASARASTPNAHFTSPQVIEAIWSGLRHLGLGKGAQILEPAMGVGHFFGLMPDSMQGGHRTGVEPDSVTARIARKLYRASPAGLKADVPDTPAVVRPAADRLPPSGPHTRDDAQAGATECLCLHRARPRGLFPSSPFDPLSRRHGILATRTLHPRLPNWSITPLRRRRRWLTSYKSVPGRSMMILVRDAAAPNHPVIGIASLASSVVQQSTRDKWIGWEGDTVVERFRESKQPKTCVRWLLSELDAFTKGLYLKDLLRDKVIARSDIRRPSDAVIDRLLKDSLAAIKKHRLYPDASKHKQMDGTTNSEWADLSETSLFRSKRSKQLATMLTIRKLFLKLDLAENIAVEKWQELFKSPAFRQAVRQIVRMVKAERVGIAMMDIAICGAVAPYNSLLGGKLVSLLLCSPEIIKEYEARYGEQTSLIASCMRGASVKRSAQLVLLCTTSLYGSALNQYSRLKLPTRLIGGNEDATIEYKNLGVSEGFGSFHFSKDSLRMMATLLGRSKESRKVNSIFGEGVNPLMRKIREGLALLGLPADTLLKHGSKRMVYGVSLASNFGDFLLGLSDTPHYLLPLTRVKRRTELIADYWRQRWLLKRIAKPGLLDEVATHTCVYWAPSMQQLDLLSYLPPLPNIHFQGDSYNPAFDCERLNAQQRRVHDALLNAGWKTLRQVADMTGDPEASISARLRDFNNHEYLKQFFIMESERVPGKETRGLPNDDNILSKWASMDLRTWMRNRAAILAFWVLGPDARWRQKRLDVTRKYVDDLVNKKSAAGKASALKRQQTHSTPVQQNHQHNASSEKESESETEPNGSYAPLPPKPNGASHAKPKRERQHKPTTFIPQDFRGDIGCIALAGKFGLDFDDEQRRFTDHWLAKGEARADWQASFRTWLANSAKYRAEREQRKSSGRPEPQGVVAAALRVAARHNGSC